MAKKSNNGKSNLQGTTEDDILDGGNGKDVITGDAGNDEVIGGNGKDVLDGGSGDDAMSGDNGKDVMNFNALENMDSSNSFDGGRGKDTLNLDLANITITSDQYNDLLSQLAELEADIAANGRANNEGDVEGGQDYTLDIEGVISLRVQNVEILNILNLNQVNIIPEAIDDDITLDEDSSFTLDVLANDFDRNNQEDALDDDVLSVVSFEDSMTIGSVINHGDGTFSYDTNGMFDYLAVGESTTDSFEYTISDGSGGFATATVHVTITGVNDGPVANDDSATIDEDHSITIDALANDTDVDASDTHTIDLASVSSGRGSVAIIDNKLVFTPDHQDLAVGESEAVEITYTMSDNHGATSTATVSITVTGENDGPVARDDSASIDEDNSLTLDVLANDSDIDASDILSIASASVSDGRGSVAIVDNKLVFTPNHQDLAVGESEDVEITYSISDGNGGTATAKAMITVTGENDGPVARDDSASIDEDNRLTLDVLANDSDIDASDILSIDAASVSAGRGSVSIVDNKLVYTPDHQDLAVGESESVEITYSINDGNGGMATAKAMVTVTGENDAPVANADLATVDEDSEVTIDALENDTDIDLSDTHVITSASISNGGGSVSIVNNQLVYSAVEKYEITFDDAGLNPGDMADLFYGRITDWGMTGNSRHIAVGEDDSISDSQYGVLNKALNTDAVFLFDGQSQGVYEISYINYIPQILSDGSTNLVGTTGRGTDGINLQQTTTPGEGWVFQAGYMVGDDGVTPSFSAWEAWPTPLEGGRVLASNNPAPIVYDEWVEVKYVVDLDNDVINAYYDGQHVFEVGPYSVDINLGGMALFPVATANSEYYVDDFKLEAISGNSQGDYQYLAVGETAEVEIEYTIEDNNGAESTSTATVTVTGLNDGPEFVGVLDDSMTLNFDASSSEYDASARRMESHGTEFDDFGFNLFGSISVANTVSEFSAITKAINMNGDWNGDSGGILRDENNANKSMQHLPGDPTNDGGSTFEVWYRADDSSALDREQILFETGGNGAGTTISLDGRDVIVTIQNSQASEEVLRAENAVSTSDFSQVVLMYDKDVGTTQNDVIRLYIDGQLKDSVTVTDINDWDGGDGAAIGRTSWSTSVDSLDRANSGGTADNFDGEIAIMRFYERAFGEDAIQDAFNAVANGTVAITNVKIQDSDIHGVRNDMSHSADGSLHFADADLSDTHNVSVSAQSSGYLGEFIAAVADDSTGDGEGRIDWSFSVNDSAISHLAEGESLTQTYDITLSDGNGGEVTQSITVSIEGSNDGPLANHNVISISEDSSPDLAAMLIADDTDPEGDALSFVSAYSYSDAMDSNWSTTMIRIDGANGANNPYINNTTEAVTLVENVDGTGLVSINGSTYNVATYEEGSASVINFGGGGYFGGDSLYPDGSAADGSLSDFIVSANNSFEFKAGTYTIAFRSDDGGMLSLNDTAIFTSRFGSANESGTDEIRFEYGRGFGDTGGTFTLDHDAAIDISALFFERGGGDRWEIFIAEGEHDAFSYADFELLQDGSLAGNVNAVDIQSVDLSSLTADYQHLAAGEAADLNLGYFVQDVHGAVSAASADITITGENDAAILGSADVSLDETDSALSTSGQLSISDVDNGEAHYIAQSDIAGDHGSFSIDADGNWSYVANSAFNELNEGDVLSDEFVVSSADGTETTVKVSINGTNDAPVAQADVIGGQDQLGESSVSSVFTGSDEGEGLDLQGEFIYAVNVGGSALTIQDVDFTDDSAAGVSISAQNIYTDWPSTSPDYDNGDGGTGAGAEGALEELMSSFRWSRAPESVVVNLDQNIEVGATYKLQMLFDEAGYNRAFDITVNGELAADNFHPGMVADADFVVQGGSDFSNDKAALMTYTFTANDDAIEIVLSGLDNGGYVDHNPILNAFTLEKLQTGLSEDGAPVALDLLSNDTDIDSDTLNIVSINTSATLGTATLENGVVMYSADGAYESLAAGESATDTLTYTISDGDGGTSTATATIYIEGENDAAILGSADVSLDETDSALSTSGQLSISDVDNGEAHFIAQSNVAGDHGSFSIDADGNWSYVANSAHDELNVGDSLVDEFSVSSADGTLTSVKVTINGTNDGAILSAADISMDETDSALSASGQLSISDIDSPESFIAQSNVAGDHGSFSIDADGNWSYVANSAFNELNEGDVLSDEFVVSSADGTETTVKVSINGTNDAPVANADVITHSGAPGAEPVELGLTISAFTGSDEGEGLDLQGDMIYAINGGGSDIMVNGLLFQDDANVEGVDLGAGRVKLDFARNTPNYDDDGSAPLAGEEAALEELMNSAEWEFGRNFTMNVGDLTVGENYQLQMMFADTATNRLFDIYIDDELAIDSFAHVDAVGGRSYLMDKGSLITYTFTAENESIDIFMQGFYWDENGVRQVIDESSNNTHPFISALTLEKLPSALQLITEDSQALSIDASSLLANDSDVDSDAISIISVNAVSSLGSYSLDASGNIVFSANGAFNHLAAGDSVTDTFEYTISDGDGGAATATASVVVNGLNDVAVLGSADVSLDETDSALSTSGTLSISDVDDGEAHYIAQSNVAGDHGVFSIDADGNWSYVANSAFDELEVGDSISDEFSVSSADGTLTSVKVTINGTNDGAILSAADVSLDETDSALSASGQLSISDVDSAESFIAQSNVPGDHGSFSIDADGNWSYVANSAHDELNVGDSLVDEFSVSSLDGTLTSVKVTINGTNDNPEVSAALSGLDNEDAAVFSMDLLEGASDVDSDALNVDASSFNVAVSFSNPFVEPFFDVSGVTLNGNIAEIDPDIYNGLAVGETATISLLYNILDGDGGSVAQSATILIEGRNDAPVIVEADLGAPRINKFTGSGEEEGLDLEGNIVYAVNVNGPTVNLNGIDFVYDMEADGVTIVSSHRDSNFVSPDFDGGGHGGSGSGDEAALEDIMRSTAWAWRGSNPNDVTITLDENIEIGATYQLQLMIADRQYERSQDWYVNGDMILDDFRPAAYVDPDSWGGPYRVINQGVLVTYIFVAEEESVVITGAQGHNAGNTGPFLQGFTLEKLPVPGLIIETVDNAPGENVDDLVAVGDVRFGDVDLSDTHVMSYSADGEDYIGVFTAELTTDTTGNVTGQVDWTFTVNDAVIDHLGEYETIEQTYTITLDDGHGGVISDTATVTMVGRNDAPIANDDESIPIYYEYGASANVFTSSVDGLDLEGNFVVAVNVGGDDVLVGDILFEGDNIRAGGTNSVEGVSVGITGSTLYYNANQAWPDFDGGGRDGSGSGAEGGLETILKSVYGAWNSDMLITIDEGILTAGSTYKLQLMNAPRDAGTSAWDIYVNGEQVNTGELDNYNPVTLLNPDTISYNIIEAVVFTYTFEATGEAVNILLDGVNYGGPGLSAFTIEELPDSEGLASLQSDNNVIFAADLLLSNDSDPDGDDFNIISVASSANGSSVSLNENGDVVYSANGAFDSLGEGQTAQDTFTYTIADAAGDQSTATATVTVFGEADAATVGDAAHVFLAEGDEGGAALSASGQLAAVSDADAGEAGYAAQSNVAGNFGTFSIAADGSWSYLANDSYSSLNIGQSNTDTFSVFSIDGSASTSVSVTMYGNEGVLLASDPVTSSLMLNYDMALADDGDNLIESSDPASRTDFNFTLTGSAGFVSASSAYSGITTALNLDGNVDSESGAHSDTFQNLGGNPNVSSDDASFELWFKADADPNDPNALTDGHRQVLFESGGNVDGITISLDGDDLLVTVQNGNSVGQEYVLQANNVVDTNEFVQMMFTYDRNADGTQNDIMKLYVNGELMSSIDDVTNLNDWSGGDGGAIGKVNRDSSIDELSVNGGNISGTLDNFDGQIALLRFYNEELSADDVATNFASIAGGGVVDDGTIAQIALSATSASDKFSFDSADSGAYSIDGFDGANDQLDLAAWSFADIGALDVSMVDADGDGADDDMHIALDADNSVDLLDTDMANMNDDWFQL